VHGVRSVEQCAQWLFNIPGVLGLCGWHKKCQEFNSSGEFTAALQDLRFPSVSAIEASMDLKRFTPHAQESFYSRKLPRTKEATNSASNPA
jgi:hypothetical protein